MDQEQLEQLLGRPLTPIEVDNLDLYLEIAEDRLSDLLCTSIEDVTESRIFDIRKDYKTVMLDVFTEINSIEHDGVAITDYTVYQWNKRNGSWFNSIVLDKCLDGELEIDADWGFDVLPADLQLLTAKLFALVGVMNNGNGNIKTKEVEDFKVTFNESTEYDQFVSDNWSTIEKYSLCREVNVQHGYVSNIY
jgi:hypothetical protein